MGDSRGRVRFWHDDDGWGVLDPEATPGGCWTSFGAVLTAGFRSLRPGQVVDYEWERADQDGYAYRTVRAWPAGTERVHAPIAGPSDAYRSTLSVRYDAPALDQSSPGDQAAGSSACEGQPPA